MPGVVQIPENRTSLRCRRHIGGGQKENYEQENLGIKSESGKQNKQDQKSLMERICYREVFSVLNIEWRREGC